jgi:hypothetical protein
MALMRANSGLDHAVRANEETLQRAFQSGQIDKATYDAQMKQIKDFKGDIPRQIRVAQDNVDFLSKFGNTKNPLFLQSEITAGKARWEKKLESLYGKLDKREAEKLKHQYEMEKKQYMHPADKALKEAQTGYYGRMPKEGSGGKDRVTRVSKLSKDAITLVGKNLGLEKDMSEWTADEKGIHLRNAKIIGVLSDKNYEFFEGKPVKLFEVSMTMEKDIANEANNRVASLSKKDIKDLEKMGFTPERYVESVKNTLLDEALRLITQAKPTGGKGGLKLSGDDVKAVKEIKPKPKPEPKAEGLREDGTQKGPGYFGVLDLPNGKVATEYSIGVSLDGKETQIPTLVPTLTKGELNLMVNDIIPNKKEIPKTIINKAISHAKARIRAGKSPFKERELGVQTPHKSLSETVGDIKKWSDKKKARFEPGGDLYEKELKRQRKYGR